MWNWDSEMHASGIDISSGSNLNMGYEVTDKVCENGFGKKTAIIWRGKTGMEQRLTYEYLADESSRFAAFLKHMGISRGERVFTYSDRTPEHYISILGILKAGAVAGALFSSFGQDAARDRLSSSGAAAVIVQAPLLGNLLKVIHELPSLRKIIVVGDAASCEAASSAESVSTALIPFEQYKSFDSCFPVEKTSPEDAALIHFTSGTTGKPKGAVHAHAALLGHYATSKHVLDLKKDDIYWCTADLAWVTGMSYGILGPLSNAVTQVSVEGNLTPRMIFETIEKYKVTVLYTAPTLLRMMMREKDGTIAAYDFTSLRHIASVGEALNPEANRWAQAHMGQPVHDTWFQTETGCIIIANVPGEEVVLGSMGKPIPPVYAEILGEDFKPLPAGSIGILALRPGWPSMFRGYWKASDSYEAKFKNGWYLTGDKAVKDENGRFRFVARDDDVINTAGHLVSPFEVESALIEHPLVAETAVIGLPDVLLAEKIKAFVVLKNGVEPSGQLKIQLRAHVRRMLSPFAVPQEIDFVSELPKTSTGKIMRRELKR